jgi:hypothetical protein
VCQGGGVAEARRERHRPRAGTTEGVLDPLVRNPCLDDRRDRETQYQRPPHRRWLLGLEPIFEGGWQGERAGAWDVEDELIAIAFLGDVTIDLSQTNSAPAEIAIDANAVLRDVDVLVAEGTPLLPAPAVHDLRKRSPVGL